jgi:hypothetical protein
VLRNGLEMVERGGKSRKLLSAVLALVPIAFKDLYSILLDVVEVEFLLRVKIRQLRALTSRHGIYASRNLLG